MLFTLLLFMSFSSCFGQERGYAVFDSSTGTLTFQYGTPTGTLNTDYYNTDNTGTNTPGWYDKRTSIKKVVFDSSFAKARPRSCAYWFAGCANLTEIEDGNCLNTSAVTTMFQMFYVCSKLTSLDVSKWVTGNVTNMGSMFGGCRDLTSLGADNVKNWNTGNVTNMYGMFIDCSSLTSLDVSEWNVRKVKNMNYMFADCSNLNSLDVSRWETYSVTNMGYMFYGCSKLTYLGVSNVRDWNTSNVKDMNSMFYSCSGLKSLDVGNWDTGKVTNMACMFELCKGLTLLDISNWKTGDVTSIFNMFHNCKSLTYLNVSNWNTGKVTNMGSVFSGCSCLTSLTFGENFITASCTNFSSMFSGCSKLRYIDFYASNNVDAIKAVDRSNDLFSGVPETTVIYLPKGSQAVSNVVNVVYSYNGDGNNLRCPNYYSEDKVDIEFPREFKTTKAEYSRTMKAATQYGTVILPYEFTTNESVQAYLLRAEHTGTMWYEEVESVPAHTPFFYSKKTAGDTNVNFNKTVANYGITVEATHTTSNAEGGAPYDADSGMDGWTTKGYYITETVDASSGNTYYISDDKFWHATGTLKMYPHRVTYQGQWQYGPDATEAPAMLNVITMGASETGDDLPSEVSTAIEAAHLHSLQQNARDIYDAQGRRQSELKSGLNIVRMADGTTVKIVKR